MVLGSTAAVVALAAMLSVVIGRFRCSGRWQRYSWVWQNEKWWPQDRDQVVHGGGFALDNAHNSMPGFEASPEDMVDPFAVPADE
mgnify:CR=1 FL=1